MSSSESKIKQRIGVRPQFPKPATFLKRFTLAPQGALEGRTWEANEIPRLRRYVEQGPYSFRYTPDSPAYPYDIYSASQDMGYLGTVYRWHANYFALTHQEQWRDCWGRATAYDYWCARMNFHAQVRIFADYQAGRRAQLMGMLAFHHIGAVIGNCLALSWHEWAADLAHRTRNALDQDGFFDGGDESHRRAQHFVLRLVSNWQGWPERSGPLCAFDEPLFNALVERWKTPDPTTLAPLLLAACDRHTHQARVDSNQASYDFHWMDSWYVPFEVLSVLRLRETSGLKNPALDHPLMNTLFGRLPHPSQPYTDDLLEGVIARARQEFVDL